jgi:hypothetical protein
MELAASLQLFALSALFLLCFDDRRMLVLAARVHFLPAGQLGLGCLNPRLFFGLGRLGDLSPKSLANLLAVGEPFAQPFVGCSQPGKLAFETRLGLVSFYDFAPKLPDRRIGVFQL